jgi:hypothetical protein
MKGKYSVPLKNNRLSKVHVRLSIQEPSLGPQSHSSVFGLGRQAENIRLLQIDKNCEEQMSTDPQSVLQHCKDLLQDIRSYKGIQTANQSL